jgi:hypothetical protein
MTKTEAAEIIARHASDEAGYIYRDVLAEMDRIHHLPLAQRAELVMKLEAVLDSMKFSVEDERRLTP